jgi:hypothetical protein
MPSINLLITMLPLGLLFFGLPAIAPGPAKAPDKTTAPGAKTTWIVQKSSSLSINGRTNISRFSCGIAQYGEPDTITILKEECRDKTTGIPLCGVLRINIEDFDCRNRVMTGEFKRTLHFRQYPHLKITFLNLEKMPVFGPRPETLTGQVVIELAGVSKQVVMEYASEREDAETIQLTGSRRLCFSDFGLQPPQKMGGLIHVDQSLDVRFILCMRQI